MLEISNTFVIPLLLLAMVLVIPISKILGIEAKPHKYSSIDGLRGFLAVLVFIHHSSMWYYYTHVHSWSIIPSALFNQFGSTSVALFFMITAFLFFSKLIEATSTKMDWLKLYVSRAVRILPLYFGAMIILFLLVAIVSRFTLRESIGNLFLHMGQWLFVMEPDINGVSRTKLIISGVQWSLAYEWLFYFSLAIVGAIFFRLKTSSTTILFALLGIAFFILVIYTFYSQNVWYRLSHFLGGIAAAFLARNQRFRKLASDVAATPVIVLLLFIGSTYNNIFSWIPYLCMVLAFIGIACGNTLFGLLTLRPSRLLGQISYSVYLLHGLLLFSAVTFITGAPGTQHLSPLGWWLFISGCCVALIILTCLTYNFIERPCLESAGRLTERLRRYLYKSAKPDPQPQTPPIPQPLSISSTPPPPHPNPPSQ